MKKGDTLRNIANTYDVEFEELKKMNAHLAHPDMIMPGMKIRIPVYKQEEQKESKNTKNQKSIPLKKEGKLEHPEPKEKKKKQEPSPIHPMGQIKEDDNKEHKNVQPTVPFEQQKAPSLNMGSVPKMPTMPDMPHISPISEEKESKKQKEAVKKQPLPDKKEQEQEHDHSIPLTSYGCHCYCGSCTPMHFGGTDMNQMMHAPFQQQEYMMQPQQQSSPQQQMYMMQPSPCGSQNQMMHMQSQQMPQSSYDRSYQYVYAPQGYQQIPTNPMMPTHMPAMQMNDYPEDKNMQPQQSEVNRSMEQQEHVPVRQPYPPMYAQHVQHGSYPQPPAFSNESQNNNNENK